MTDQIDQHSALIYTMVLIAAANGDMTDQELNVMGRIVQTLPAFRDFDKERLIEVGQGCAELLRDDDGLDEALDRIHTALPQRLRETSYALACEVAAVDGQAESAELQVLEMLRHRLGIERLTAAAIERATRARYATV
jgi:tellurite resistance protein